MEAFITFWFGWLLAATVVLLHICQGNGRCRWYQSLRQKGDVYVYAVTSKLLQAILHVPQYGQRLHAVLLRLVHAGLLTGASFASAFEQWLRRLSLRLSHHRMQHPKGKQHSQRSAFLSQVQAHKAALRAKRKEA